MLIMEYRYIGREYLPDYAKKATWNLLHAYIDLQSQRLIDEYTRDGVQAISILKSKCANTIFADQSRYIRMFRKVMHKRAYLAINYIQIFQNVKALEISVGNSYSEI